MLYQLITISASQQKGYPTSHSTSQLGLIQHQGPLLLVPCATPDASVTYLYGRGEWLDDSCAGAVNQNQKNILILKGQSIGRADESM